LELYPLGVYNEYPLEEYKEGKYKEILKERQDEENRRRSLVDKFNKM